MLSIWYFWLDLLVYLFLYIFHVTWLFWWIYVTLAHVWPSCWIDLTFIIRRYIILSISAFFPIFSGTSLCVNVFIMIFDHFQINGVNTNILASIVVRQNTGVGHCPTKNMTTDINLLGLVFVRIFVLFLIIGYRLKWVRLRER
jgi:hypothetical protein